MSDYKMVPVVATIEMLGAAYEQRSAFARGIVQPVYQAMLAKAPPFVVTDEMAEAALTAYRNHPLPQKLSDMQKSNRDAMRAAIEAVLGGGV